jgi:hypothetical protein
MHLDQFDRPISSRPSGRHAVLAAVFALFALPAAAQAPGGEIGGDREGPRVGGAAGERVADPLERPAGGRPRGGGRALAHRTGTTPAQPDA